MQKRKIKINILDVAIFLAIICSVAALFFRDTITEVFEQPEIATVEISLVAEKLPEDSSSFLVAGKEAVVKYSDGDGTKINANLKSVKTDSEGKTTFTVVCSGYKKLGRYYTESGEKLNINGDYVLNFGTVSLDCTLDSVEIDNIDKKHIA